MHAAQAVATPKPKANAPLHPLMAHLDVRGLTRIDVGLEGDWSGQLATVWRRGEGIVEPLPQVAHERFTPSLELYYPASAAVAADVNEGASTVPERTGWIGIHCYRVEHGMRVLDHDYLRAVIAAVQAAIAASA